MQWLSTPVQDRTRLHLSEWTASMHQHWNDAINILKTLWEIIYLGKAFLVLCQQNSLACARSAHTGHFSQTGRVKVPVLLSRAHSSRKQRSDLASMFFTWHCSRVWSLICCYLFPNGMSVMMMSTELVLMGKSHKSHRTVSMGSPDTLFERTITNH